MEDVEALENLARDVAAGKITEWSTQYRTRLGDLPVIIVRANGRTIASIPFQRRQQMTDLETEILKSIIRYLPAHKQEAWLQNRAEYLDSGIPNKADGQTE